jgi:tubulin-specific chaperone D
VQVVPLVATALHYDERRAAFSIGQHVRDAAAYVCWAFARVYKADAMSAALPVLTPALLAAACYDREVNCRRAASAAFQEAVGRLGAQHFPHGIDILTSADYFALGSRREAYLTIGPAIARLPQYRVPLAEHLLQRKLANWDIAVRELAAEALAPLVLLQPGYFRAEALASVMARATDARSIEERHLLAALHGTDAPADVGAQRAAVALALHLHEGGFCRGKGGELMRVACCRVIAALSEIHAPLEGDEVCLQAHAQDPPLSPQCGALAHFTAVQAPLST